MGPQNSQPSQIQRPSAQTNLMPREPYNLAQQTKVTYQTLLLSCNNNEFLNLPPTDNKETQIQLRYGYYKLKAYDAFYYGEWKRQQPCGRGIIRFPDGSTLIGMFKNNYCSGSGCYAIFKDGSYYKGNIFENILSGNGTLISKKVEYNGNWINNLPHGQGVQTFSNGDRYVGNFQFGLKHGPNSLFIWNNHSIYKQYRGNFKNGKICGEGILTLKKDNTTIEGIFDQSEVSNVVLNCQRCKFSGNFKQGKITGKGKIQIRDIMETFDGNFREGQLYGKCIVLDHKKRQTQLYFFKGKQLRKVNGFEDKEIEKIIATIQKCYDGAQKHSDALIQLKNQLTGVYECKFIEPFEHVFTDTKYIIASIFEKTLMISETENQ